MRGVLYKKYIVYMVSTVMEINLNVQRFQKNTKNLYHIQHLSIFQFIFINTDRDPDPDWIWS